jgi:hypothetical protein
MEKLDKVIQVLSLVNSEKRDATLQNIVLYILYSLNEACTLKDVHNFISDEFEVSFSLDELQNIITQLESVGKVSRKSSKYSIASDISEDINNAIRISKEKTEVLFQEFDQQISKLGGIEFSESRKRELFKSFQEYLCECIYIFGRGSVNIFKKNSADFQDTRLKVLRALLLSIKVKEERDVISLFIKTFPDNLTSTQVDLINDLIERSEDFYSLGLSEDQFDELRKANFMDWVFFLDTNVLYSILDLHVHPENDACIKILEILKSNPEIFKIKLSYLQKTHNELKKKRQVFDQYIPKTIYSESQIKAMLNSQKLDSFSERYLQKMLQLGSDTPHPTESIDRHITILKSKGIEINRKDLAVDEASEYFTQCISDYKRVESILNEAKFEKTHQMKPPKDIEKVEHDIFLREAIKRFRILKPFSLNDCKFFGITIDTYLLKYDQYQLKHDSVTSDLIFPTFFRPAFILSKLLKLVPVKTNDYKKAFVKSLLALSISDGRKKNTKTILKTVSRFKAMGLEDPKVILSCITDDFFLRKIEEAQTENEDALIQTLLQEKIEKQITSVEVENESLREKLDTVEQTHASTLDTKNTLETEINNLKNRYEQTVDDLRIFRKEFDKLKAKKEKTKVEKDKADQLSIEQPPVLTPPLPTEDSPLEKPINERMINWPVVGKKLFNAGRTISKAFFTLNLIFALFFLFMGCIDFPNSQTYFVVAGVGAIVTTVMPSRRLRWKLLIELIVLSVFVTFFFANSQRINGCLKSLFVKVEPQPVSMVVI